MPSSFYERVQTDRRSMPPNSMQREWGKEARAIYEQDRDHIGVTEERFVENYIWEKIVTYQTQRRAMESAGRVC